MSRTMARFWIAAVVLAALLTAQLGVLAPTASAATTCKDYDIFPAESGSVYDVRVCAAPGSDFPGYSGWGRVVQNYSTQPDICGFSLLPYDMTDPMPAYACIALAPAPVVAWRWTGSSWAKSGLDIGTAAYFAPYATGWRWAWTQETGWVAIEQRHAAFRWYG